MSAINPLVLARVKKGVDVKPLAKKLGLNPHTIWRWENGERMPKIANLHAVADELGVDVGELYTDMHVWRESK